MKNRIEDRLPEDEFTPIELGSVSEETRGIPGEGLEVIQFNSFELA